MEKNKKRIVIILLILFASLPYESARLYAAVSNTAIGNAAKSDPGSNRGIPTIELPMPANEQAKSYLGLSGAGNFKIGQIKAEVLIIQVFSYY